MTRKQIYEIIEKDDGSNVWSHLYDVFMFVTIILSVVPLMFWDYRPIFTYIEIFTTTIFIIDYVLRWVTNYNSLCTQILDLAISQENQYLAKKVIKMYKQNVINERAYRNENSDDYKVMRTWADKEAAIAKCKEAGINL